MVQLRDEIIIPTLMEMGPEFSSYAAVELLLGTAAQESAMGTYIKQLNGGPALGIYQMEPATHDDIWQNYLAYNPNLIVKVERVCPGGHFKPERMVWDLKYATIMCRLHYYRRPEALPSDHEGFADYWKQFYNTELGDGTVDQYLANVANFIDNEQVT